MNYQLKFPGKILFGTGSRFEISKVVDKKSPILIVSGSHALKAVEEDILPQLRDCEVLIHTGVRAEVPLDDVDIIVQKGEKIKAKIIIAVGGGSVIDASKTAAALMYNQGSVSDYFYKIKEIKESFCKFIALPTTSGTGAEITPNAVLCDHKTQIKQSIKSDCMYANVAIVDPYLTFGSPLAISSSSGFDALTQAIEGFISKKANSVSMALSATAFKLIYTSLESACKDDDYIARSNTSEGSMIAAMAFAQCGLGAVHGIGHPVGSILGVSHGVCCSIFLPTILDWNISVCEEKLNELAKIVDVSSGKKLIENIRLMRLNLGLPINFKQWNLSAKHYDFILKNCRSGSMATNPRDLSDDDVIEILKELS